jgi:hypothetical protein
MSPAKRLPRSSPRAYAAPWLTVRRTSSYFPVFSRCANSTPSLPTQNGDSSTGNAVHGRCAWRAATDPASERAQNAWSTLILGLPRGGLDPMAASAHPCGAGPRPEAAWNAAVHPRQIGLHPDDGPRAAARSRGAAERPGSDQATGSNASSEAARAQAHDRCAAHRRAQGVNAARDGCGLTGSRGVSGDRSSAVDRDRQRAAHGDRAHRGCEGAGVAGFEWRNFGTGRACIGVFRHIRACRV